MREAEERRSASIIRISSIRLSLVGAQVDWITNTSLPRTFSLISMLISPSLKRLDGGAAEAQSQPLHDHLRQFRVGTAGEEHHL